MTRNPTLFALAVVLGLSACGKVGALEQPAPLYGDKAKADYQAAKAAKAAADQARKDDGDIERLPGERPYDPNLDLTPQRTHPIEGTPSDPNRPQPQGVLPDPIARPQ
ncbi:MAG: hypothetical protein JOZ27_03580 [Caulobacteraceae bacterium]|nr:hypothetical protein [Caulobacteraceae bacterium]